MRNQIGPTKSWRVWPRMETQSFVVNDCVGTAASAFEDFAHQASGLIHLCASFNPQAGKVDEKNVLFIVEQETISELH